MIQATRIQTLNPAPLRPEADYVLYWMQQSQRARCNPALELAIAESNDLGLPVLVAFGLTAFPDANARHYDFMLRGLAETAARLQARGVGFVIRKQRPDRLALALSRRAALVVCDRGYLRVQRAWREALAARIDRRLIQVEGDVVVPVDTASSKHEYAARTLRPKLHRLWEEHLTPVAETSVARRADLADFGLAAAGDDLGGEVDLSDVAKVVAGLQLDHSVGAGRRFEPGEDAARARLKAFLEDGLGRYAGDRGRPEAGAASMMSPYLHFGQISPLEIALSVREAGSAGGADSAAYLEELIVRRELACNHAIHEPRYDAYDALPAWARQTLAAHADDPRPHLYDEGQLERGETHDPYWNAAMLEMRATGYMHNQLRMYWGKKVLQWSRTPEQAFETLLRLNNRWFLDGRDPNSFTNVGWIFGLHDRPWGPQPVFGTVRSMGPNSLRKFDADAYVAGVQALAQAEG